MIKYWYCGNIPPRPLDEKVKDLDGWDGKDKKNLKMFHKTLIAVGECGRLEVGRLECGRL
jgi:hypothetical protein